MDEQHPEIDLETIRSYLRNFELPNEDADYGSLVESGAGSFQDRSPSVESLDRLTFPMGHDNSQANDTFMGESRIEELPDEDAITDSPNDRGSSSIVSDQKISLKAPRSSVSVERQ